MTLLQKAQRRLLRGGEKFQAIAADLGIAKGSDDYNALRDLARKQFENQLQPVKTMPVTSIQAKAPSTEPVEGDESDAPGHLIAVFSTFNVMDDEGDVVMSGAVHEESDVPFTWGHNWSQPSLGKGDVSVDYDRAVWDGYLFVDDMQSAKETFASIKNMGARQEYSWSFMITDYSIEEDDDAPWGFKRLIKDTEMIEVCGAIRGVNRHTSTLLAKGHGGPHQAKNMLEALLGMPLADVPIMDLAGDEDESGEGEKGSRLEDQIGEAQAAIADLMERVTSLAESRAKDGRTIGKSSLDLLADLRDDLSNATALLADLTEEKSAQPAGNDSTEAMELFRDTLFLEFDLEQFASQ